MQEQQEREPHTEILRETGLEGVVQQSPEIIYGVCPAEWRAVSKRMNFVELLKSLTEAARAGSIDELAACSEAALSKIFRINRAEVRIHTSQEEAKSYAYEGLGRCRFRIDSQPRGHAIATIFFNDVDSVRRATTYCRAPLEAFMQRFGTVVEKKLRGYGPSDKRADLGITGEKGLGMLWFDISPVKRQTYTPSTQQPSVRMDPFVNRLLRAEDFTIRYEGGSENEFLTYTFGCTSDDVALIGRRIYDAVQSAYVDDEALRRTVSMGASHSSEITGGVGSVGLVHKLMGITEQRLYQAKSGNDGKGKIVGPCKQDPAKRPAGYLTGSVIVAGDGRYITGASLMRRQ